MNALRDQQQQFADFINNGVGEALSKAVRENGLSGERRLSIYQHSVTIGLRDALGGVYEVVKKLVGDEFFHHVAVDYLRQHHSLTGNVHDFGKQFPQFLSTFPGLESLPYLPDVARLEWLYHVAFHSPMGEMLNIERLSQVPESSYGRINLLFSPSCYLFSSEFPVLRIWQVNQDDYLGDVSVSLDEGGVKLAIVREGKNIVFHPLQKAAFTMLEAISSNVSFGQACEAALAIDAECDIGGVLRDAVLHRMIVGFAVNE